MKRSSDKESNASRAQRQAVGGAPQARSGVERVNQRRNPGESMVARLSGEVSCSEHEQTRSLSQKLQLMRNQRCGQFAGVNIGMTRAALDQRKREQRVLLREKKMRIQYLKKRCEEIAVEVNSQFDQLTERLLNYQGEPNWLTECFTVFFNESSAAVIEHEKEIKQLYKEVAELKQAVHRKIEKQKNGPSVSSVQNIPANLKMNVQEAERQPTVSGILVHTNPFEVLDHEIHLAHEEISVTSDSDEEEVFKLMDPRRHKTECSVSSLDDRQDISDVGLSVNSNVHYESAYENRDQN